MGATGKALGHIVSDDTKVPLITKVDGNSYLLVVNTATQKTNKLQASKLQSKVSQVPQKASKPKEKCKVDCLTYQLKLKRGRFKTFTLPRKMDNALLFMTPVDNYGVGQGSVSGNKCKLKGSKSGLYNILIFIPDS